METYVSRRHNTVAQFIVIKPIMDLCLAAERRPGLQVYKRWRKQDRVDVEGMRTAVREAEQTEGGKETDGEDTATD